MQETTQEESCGSGLSEAGEKLRESEDLWTSTFLGGQSGV